MLSESQHRLLTEIVQDWLDGLLDLPPKRVLQLRVECRIPGVSFRTFRSGVPLVDDGHAFSGVALLSSAVEAALSCCIRRGLMKTSEGSPTTGQPSGRNRT
ncbi:MAG: hypothetical protein U0893_23130 [Chloroflexota bacterium]